MTINIEPMVLKEILTDDQMDDQAEREREAAKPKVDPVEDITPEPEPVSDIPSADPAPEIEPAAEVAPVAAVEQPTDAVSREDLKKKVEAEHFYKQRQQDNLIKQQQIKIDALLKSQKDNIQVPVEEHSKQVEALRDTDPDAYEAAKERQLEQRIMNQVSGQQTGQQAAVGAEIASTEFNVAFQNLDAQITSEFNASVTRPEWKDNLNAALSQHFGGDNRAMQEAIVRNPNVIKGIAELTHHRMQSISSTPVAQPVNTATADQNRLSRVASQGAPVAEASAATNGGFPAGVDVAFLKENGIHTPQEYKRFTRGEL